MQLKLTSLFNGLVVILLLISSLIAHLIFDIPSFVTAFGIGFILIALILPIVISTAYNSPRRDLLSVRPQHIIGRKNSVAHLLLQVCLAGTITVLVFIGFLLMNNISPNGLTANGATYAKAVTVASITLALCMIARIVITNAHERHAHTSSLLYSKHFWLSLAVVGAFIYGFGYSQLFHSIFLTSSPQLTDWFIIMAGVIIFIVLSAALHYDHHHTRHSVSQLNREK